jgi:hypothetical protein
MTMRAAASTLLLIAATTLMTGCGSKEHKPCPTCPPNPTPSTHFMTANVNDQHWEAQVLGGSSEAPIVAVYDPSLHMLAIMGICAPHGPSANDVSLLTLVALGPLEPGNVPLGDTEAWDGSTRIGDAGYQNGSETNEWITDGTQTGALVIDSIDRNAGIVGGRFEFTAISSTDGSVVHVTSGRFSAALTSRPGALAAKCEKGNNAGVVMHGALRAGLEHREARSALQANMP